MVDSADPNDCPFCAITRGEARADIVARSASWVAFVPLHPATTGHTLLVPRQHVRDYWALDAALAQDLAVAAVDVGRVILAVLKPDGMNLITSSGRVAEQTVFHLHIHLVPRWRDDGFGDIWPPARIDRDRIRHDVAEELRRAYESR